jgi:hypothetical protein
MSVTVTITADASVLQALRNGIAERAQLHAEIAVAGESFVKKYLRGLSRHKTANQLGANPTNHLEKASATVTSTSNSDAAVVQIPSRTGLRRAFVDFDIVPKNGRKYLTIPAHRTTYGKRAGEITESLRFAIVGGRHKALVFDSGPDIGSVAYWLRTKVHIKQDRSLLPSDAALQAVGRKASIDYVTGLLRGGVA